MTGSSISHRRSPPYFPCPPPPHPTPASQLSPRTSLTPDLSSVYSILYPIHAIYLCGRYLRTLTPPRTSPPAPTTPGFPPPKNNKYLTPSSSHDGAPPVAHTSSPTPYDPSYDAYRSLPRTLMTGSSISHRRSPPCFPCPPPLPTPASQLSPRTSLAPDLASVYSILYPIHAIYLCGRYLRTLTLPRTYPPAPTTPGFPPPNTTNI